MASPDVFAAIDAWKPVWGPVAGAVVGALAVKAWEYARPVAATEMVSTAPLNYEPVPVDGQLIKLAERTPYIDGLSNPILQAEPYIKTLAKIRIHRKHLAISLAAIPEIREQFDRTLANADGSNAIGLLLRYRLLLDILFSNVIFGRTTLPKTAARKQQAFREVVRVNGSPGGFAVHFSDRIMRIAEGFNHSDSALVNRVAPLIDAITFDDHKSLLAALDDLQKQGEEHLSRYEKMIERMQPVAESIQRLVAVVSVGNRGKSPLFAERSCTLVFSDTRTNATYNVPCRLFTSENDLDMSSGASSDDGLIVISNGQVLRLIVSSNDTLEKIENAKSLLASSESGSFRGKVVIRHYGLFGRRRQLVSSDIGVRLQPSKLTAEP